MPKTQCAKIRNMTTIDKDNVHEFLARYDNFLFDCDGVIWLDEKLVPGVKKTIEFLKGQGKRIAFVTNNSSKSRHTYLDKFARLGIDVSKDIIYPTCYAAAAYLKETIAPGLKVWVLGDHGIEDELREEGFIPLGGTDTQLDQPFKPEHELLQVDPEVQAVVVGSTKEFNYMRIALTLQYLLHDNKRIPFIGTNIDRTYPGPEGLILPAGGSVVYYMKYTANRDFVDVGKPSLVFLDTIIHQQGFDKSRTIMVGDTLYTDIKFGNDGKLGNGRGSLLVLTGGTKPEDLADIADVLLQPSYVIPSLGQLAELV